MLPQPPTNYQAVLDGGAGATVTLSWVNGADATEVIHELSQNGTDWEQLDHDTVPAVTSDHSLGQDTHYFLRAKSRNSEGDSGYTPAVEITTGHYDP